MRSSANNKRKFDAAFESTLTMNSKLKAQKLTLTHSICYSQQLKLLLQFFPRSFPKSRFNPKQQQFSFDFVFELELWLLCLTAMITCRLFVDKRQTD